MSTIVPPLRSLLPAADVQGFFELVGKALAIHINTQGPPDGITPDYVEDFPKERLTQPGAAFEVITFRVDGSQMSSTSNDRDRRPRGPEIRERKPHPKVDGYNLVTLGWWEDVTVVFTISSKTNSNANRLGVWFHKFMMKYAFALKFFDGRGIQQFRFAQRLPDSVDQIEGQEIYKREYAYSFRIEYLDAAMERQLTNASLTVNGQTIATLFSQ
jgi:hypothetical protein